MEISTSILVLLIVCILFACVFEFINGFHDTANAVATVIYTNTMKPVYAVMWSGAFNFFGVFMGGIAVAMGIVDLLPVEMLIEQSVSSSIAMVLSLILGAIIWNFGTWYFGIPASSSHTMIGSILGVGLAFSLTPGQEFGSGVNWSKATDIGSSLLASPLFGFGVALMLMYILSRTIQNKVIFHAPKANEKPPMWVRFILMTTCTLVSFFHGSNDGQKGVGLVMLILIGILPAYYAIDDTVDPSSFVKHTTGIREIMITVNPDDLAADDRKTYGKIMENLDKVESQIKDASTVKSITPDTRFHLRSELLYVTRKIEKMVKNGKLPLDEKVAKELKGHAKDLRNMTDYAPTWVLVIIAFSLGIGTMVGWKRIVVTIGEKIGKTHMSYAQGASAEIVAASTIGLSTYMGLPVSTTHVLSSGVAGSMVAQNGIKNLQPKTIRTILMAWILTLPVTMLLSGGLFLLFRQLI
ncbi:MAG: inorganic phosphate transporter [Flavobacteriales bacterium]|nr:inorganic phosphate transporter [Flavobacteriales bacterium]